MRSAFKAFFIRRKLKRIANALDMISYQRALLLTGEARLVRDSNAYRLTLLELQLKNRNA